jgi:hypothetical protein
MATYKILSNNTSLGSAGSLVAGKDLNGVNVQALIEGGHIEVVAKPVKQEAKESDK